jgi:phytoene dehydrogenase-like protein
VWTPLAFWLTGNDLRQLSADAFVMAVKPFFLSGGSSSRIWVPRLVWNRLLIEPIQETLTKNGATVTTSVQAVRFDVRDDRVSGVRLRDGTVVHADWYVSAVGAPKLTPLLPERWLTRYAYFQQIVDLQTFPCRVIHACTAASSTAPRLILPSSGPFPWITCVPSDAGQAVRAVLALREDAAADLRQEATSLLRTLKLLAADESFSGLTQETTESILLSLAPGTKIRRPLQRSPIANLLLAGAWTDTGWPANVESAIISGERCAEIIMHHGARPS